MTLQLGGNDIREEQEDYIIREYESLSGRLHFYQQQNYIFIFVSYT